VTLYPLLDAIDHLSGVNAVDVSGANAVDVVGVANGRYYYPAKGTSVNGIYLSMYLCSYLSIKPLSY
jgi:hypothetical protein